MRVVDVNVTLRRPAGPPDAPATGVRDAVDGDREAVLDIAEHDYSVSRFHLDPEIPDSRAQALKRAWVDNFFRGERGDRLLVHGDDPDGFHLILDGDDARVVELIAVARRARGRGAGSALLRALFAIEPARDVVVGTQVSNTGSLRLYQRLPAVVREPVGWAYRSLPASVRWGKNYVRFRELTERAETVWAVLMK